MIQTFRDFPGLEFEQDEQGNWLCRPTFMHRQTDDSDPWSPVDIEMDFRLRVITEPGFLGCWIKGLSRKQLEVQVEYAMNWQDELMRRCLDLEQQLLHRANGTAGW